MPEATSANAVSSVGQSIPRVDGVSKVTGAAKYVDDLSMPNMLFGRTVRSQVAHGVLRAIVLDPAFDWSGVTVVTAADIPGRNVITLIEDDQPALVPVSGRIKHCDEPVALVAAATKELALRAMQHVRVEVDPMPAALSIEDALAKRAIIYGQDNIFKKFEIKKGERIDVALAKCDVVIDGTYRTPAQEQMYIEPQGVIAWWDEHGACRVIGSLQCPYYVHKALKPLTGLDEAQVIVTQAATGGGFGGKEEYPSMLAAHAVLLSRKAKRPVKMVYDRAEDVGATTKRHPAVIQHKMGFSRDGRIRAVDIDVTMDGGAYLTLSPVVLSRGILHAAGPYDIANVRVVGRAVATNYPPHGAFRGFGAPQTTFAYERQMQKAARRLGIEPFELRRRNALRLNSVTATGQTLKYSVGSIAALDSVQRQLEKPPPNRRITAKGTRLRRGRGLAFYFHGAGFTGSGEDRLKGRASVCVASDGLFEVRSGSTEIGQGTITIFTQLAAASLGVPVEYVRVCQPTTERVPDSGPTVASRTCMVVGAVVAKAAKQLRERMERYAKERGIDSKDMVNAARIHAKERGEAVETSEYTSPPGVHWDDDTYSGDAYPVYGWAACLVDVAVDMDTFEVTVERCIHAIDVGKAIHPVVVLGQIEGGTLQALGWALWEHVVYKHGRVVNRRMTDCIIPTSIEAPEMETLLVEDPYPHGPHGAKGVGEIPMDGPGAAVAGAIEDALGLPFDELPILPEKIARAWLDAEAAGTVIRGSMRP